MWRGLVSKTNIYNSGKQLVTVSVRQTYNIYNVLLAVWASVAWLVCAGPAGKEVFLV
jgi:hypothetical protein